MDGFFSIFLLTGSLTGELPERVIFISLATGSHNTSVAIVMASFCGSTLYSLCVTSYAECGEVKTVILMLNLAQCCKD